jgi:hypothetical protein
VSAEVNFACCPHCGHGITPTQWHAALKAQRGPKYQPQVSGASADNKSRSRYWRMMGIAVRFTAQDIAATTETGVRPARAYIVGLVKAGYIQVERQTTYEVGDYTIYRLVKNTGPLAPRLRNDGTVYDPNLDPALAPAAGAAA